MIGETAEMSRLKQQPPPSVQDKFRRLTWAVSYYALFRFSPIPAHAWRCLILKCFGADIGKHVRIYPSVKIWAPWNLCLRDFVTVGPGTNLYCVDKIILGEFVIISQGAVLCTATHDHRSEMFDLLTGPICVRESAWVAAEAFIGPSVTVSAFAVIGARSVVFHDVQENSVVVGNPAKFVKMRPPEGRNLLGRRTKQV